MFRASTLIAVTAGLAGLALLAAGGFGWYAQARSGLALPFERNDSAWAGSTACGACHLDQYASWHRTFHRTMTQEAGPRSVLGDFSGQALTYWGITVRPVRDDQQYFFEYEDPATGRTLARYPIQRTVGSHRYQQYLTQAPGSEGRFQRLHLLWHIGDARWVHINGAFLYSDEQGFDDHVATWNHNCIFCHNTGPQPRITNYEELHRRIAQGQQVNFLAEARYQSVVAELGIACEACHGPGAQHAAANRDPVRRYLLHADAVPSDPTIVNPARLDYRRAAQICGQCHGQRVPAEVDLVATWLHSGPTYRPGDDLSRHVRYVTTDMPGPAHDPDLYRLRFWADGTPRLSAYEYQGLLQSPCHTQATLTCIDCHSMHGGDVHGMIEAANRGNAPCLGCHLDIAADVPAHTRHAADSSGSICYECHMPRMVYGVMEIHRSHRIEIPQPAAHAAAGRPDACTSCHLDRSAAWAANALDTWRGAQPAGIDDGVSRALRMLLGGDPVERAVAAHRLGRADSALDDAARLQLIPALLAALDDDYPAIRRFAAHSLQALDLALGGAPGLAPALAEFDFIADAAARRHVVLQLRRNWNTFAQGLPPQQATWLEQGYRMQPQLLAQLRQQARSSQVRINIGE